MELQSLASQGLSVIASSLQVGYAFGAGMVSAVNPCGFVMLPVYISLYLGASEDDFASKSIVYRVLRAFLVAGMLCCGFGVVFAVIGVAVSFGGSYLMGVAPWLAMFIGAVLVLWGLSLLVGKSFSLPIMLKLASKVGDPRTISILGFFLFGIAYGAASTSCVLPIFLAVVMNSVSTGGLDAAGIQFGYYMLGVFTVLVSLTLGTALLKRGIVEGYLRKVIPYVHKLSSLFLIIAGGYIIYYWLTSGLL